MTSPHAESMTSSVAESPIVVGINELRVQAKRLGLIWELRPATVIGRNMVIQDGDVQAISAISLIGDTYVGSRVMCMIVPPDGTFIVGYAQAVVRPGMLIGKFTQTTVQSVANGGWEPLELNGPDEFDLLQAHDPSVNDSRFTPNIPGWYTFTGCVAFAGSATGRRGFRWTKNGAVIESSTLLQHAGSTSYVDTNAKSFSIYLNGQGDYVEAEINQESGGPLSTFYTAENFGSYIEVHYTGSVQSTP